MSRWNLKDWRPDNINRINSPEVWENIYKKQEIPEALKQQLLNEQPELLGKDVEFAIYLSPERYATLAAYADGLAYSNGGIQWACIGGEVPDKKIRGHRMKFFPVEKDFGSNFIQPNPAANLDNDPLESVDAVFNPDIIDAYDIDDLSTLYTVSLSPGFMVDVKVCKDSGLTYVMQNDDGSTVYYNGYRELTRPDYQYDEAAVLNLVKEAHADYTANPSLDSRILFAALRLSKSSHKSGEKETFRKQNPECLKE